MSNAHRLILFAFIVAACFMPQRSYAAEGDPLPASCDAEFYDIVRSRAWMEAQRETEISQRLITKPGDLLAYACMSTAIEIAGKTDILRRGQGNIPGFGNFQSALEGLIPSASLTCANMNEIAGAARCANVDKDILLSDLNSSEFRGCAPSETIIKTANGDLNRDQLWSAANNIVFPDSVRTPDKGGSDQAISLISHLDNTNCAAVTPIKTGRHFRSLRGHLHTGHICTPVGCVYDQIDGKCKAIPTEDSTDS